MKDFGEGGSPAGGLLAPPTSDRGTQTSPRDGGPERFDVKYDNEKHPFKMKDRVTTLGVV